MSQKCTMPTIFIYTEGGSWGQNQWLLIGREQTPLIQYSLYFLNLLLDLGWNYFEAFSLITKRYFFFPFLRKRKYIFARIHNVYSLAKILQNLHLTDYILLRNPRPDNILIYSISSPITYYYAYAVMHSHACSSLCPIE